MPITQPRNGITRGFGGIATPASSNICQIIGGNTLSWIASPGIKHIATTMTTVPYAINFTTGTPSTLPDGLGWGRSLDDDSFVLILNDQLALTTYDLMVQPVFAGYKAILTYTVGTVVTKYTAYRCVGPI